VRPRLTSHGGESLNAPDLWQQHFKTHHKRDRLAAQARIVGQRRPTTVRGVSID
jgi:hypothetical protein